MRFRTDWFTFKAIAINTRITMECNRKLAIGFVFVLLLVFVNEIGSLAVGKEIPNSLGEENDTKMVHVRSETEILQEWIKRSAANIGGKAGNTREIASNIRARRNSEIRRTRRKRVSSFPWWWNCDECDDDKF